MCQIKASAGSGKTYTLTWRYLQLLADCLSAEEAVDRYEPCKRKITKLKRRMGDILAITFTNAAVGEIRERVIHNLKKIATAKMKMRGMDKKKAEMCLEALLDDMDEMNVRTIDSLLHQITRSASLSLGLNPDFEPSFELAEAMEPYVEKYMQDAMLGDGEKRTAIHEAVENFLYYGNINSDKPRPLLLGKSLIEELQSLLIDVLLNLSEPPYTPLDQIEQAYEKYFKELVKEARILKEALNEYNQNARKELKYKLAFERSLDALDEEKWPGELKDSLGDSFPEVVSRPPNNLDTKAFDSHYELLKKNFVGASACREHLRYSRILEMGENLVANFLGDLPQAKIIPSVLIPKLAKRALSIDDGICDALCRLGSRLSHFMLDEFQDTSLEQYEGIYTLIQEALAKNGSLTWVGDVKQSIFMWRNACPELFDSICEDQSLTCMVDRVQKKRLPYNRRSAKKIVEFNNTLFGDLGEDKYAEKILDCICPTLAKNEKLKERIMSAFAGSKQDLAKNADQDGLVCITKIPYYNGKKEAEEFWANFKPLLVSFLKKRLEKGSGISPSDIMILVRANKDATFLASVLAEENIPVVSENSLLLSGEPLIEEAVALLEFMADPNNDTALLTLLCGEAFLGHPEAQGIEGEDFYKLALARGDKPFYEAFREQYPSLWEKLLKPFYKRSTIMPPYDIIREWVRLMRLNARFPERRMFLNSFLEYAYKAELNGYNSIPAFLEQWQEAGTEIKATMPEGVEAVRIMTIHKAKGLQAPIVIVPFPDLNLRSKNNYSDKRIRITHEGLNLNVRVLKAFNEGYTEHMMRETQEILNMLYVAFTRPEKELHIYTSYKAKEDGQQEKKGRLESMLEEAGLSMPYCDGKEWQGNKKENEYMEAAAPKDSSVLEIEAAFPWIDKLKIAKNTLFAAREYAEKRGSFIHFCLENLHLNAEPEEAAKKALNFALSHSGIELKPGDEDEILPGLIWFAKQAEAKEWLSKGWAEQSMLDGHGKELRVDLLVPQEWGALVLDYKSGAKSEKNVEQIHEYLKCLKESGEFAGELCGLLIYLDQREFISVDLAGNSKSSESCPKLPL